MPHSDNTSLLLWLRVPLGTPILAYKSLSTGSPLSPHPVPSPASLLTILFSLLCMCPTLVTTDSFCRPTLQAQACFLLRAFAIVPLPQIVAWLTLCLASTLGSTVTFSETPSLTTLLKMAPPSTPHAPSSALFYPQPFITC